MTLLGTLLTCFLSYSFKVTILFLIIIFKNFVSIWIGQFEVLSVCLLLDNYCVMCHMIVFNFIISSQDLISALSYHTANHQSSRNDFEIHESSKTILCSIIFHSINVFTALSINCPCFTLLFYILVKKNIIYKWISMCFYLILIIIGCKISGKLKAF